MSRFSLFFNVFRQKAPKNAVNHQNYLPYGGDADNFPLEWYKAIEESPTASSCLSTVVDFLVGYDFSDENLAKLVVNSRGETFGKIHQDTCKDWGAFSGFYWHFMYNGASQITEWQLLPFQNCRLGKPDDSGWISKIHYNPFLGTSEYKTSDKAQTIIYDAFNPVAIKDQMLTAKDKYLGQVLFIGTTTPLSPYYPVHEAYSVKPWMQIESGVADYHEDKIDNGFLNEYILVQIGDPNSPLNNPDATNANGSTPEKPKTQGDEFNDVLSSNFMGKRKHANVMVQWVNTPEEAPIVVPIPTSASTDMFLTLDNQATKKITVGWKTPAILANINEGVSLGGDGNAVRVAVKLMQQRVIRKQRVLTDAYGKVLKMLSKPYTNDVDIVPYNPYPELEVIDPTQWEALTIEERRKYIQDRSDIELIETEQPVTTPEPQTPAASQVTNAVSIAIPDKVKNVIKAALKYHDQSNSGCVKNGPRQLAEAFLNFNSHKMKDIKRVYNFLKRMEIHKDKPFNEGCEVVQYNAWGGHEMYSFLDDKIKDFDQWLN